MTKITFILSIYVFAAVLPFSNFTVTAKDFEDDDSEKNFGKGKKNKEELIAITPKSSLSEKVFDQVAGSGIRFIPSLAKLDSALDESKGTLVFLEGYWFDYADPVKVEARLMEVLHSAGDGATVVVHTAQGNNNIAGILDRAIKNLHLRNINVIALICDQEFDAIKTGVIPVHELHKGRRIYLQESIGPAYTETKGDSTQYLTTNLLYNRVFGEQRRRIMVAVMEGPNSSANRLMRYFAKAQIWGMRGDINKPEFKLFIGADSNQYSGQNSGHAATQIASIRSTIGDIIKTSSTMDFLDVNTGKAIGPRLLAKRVRDFDTGKTVLDLPLEGMESRSLSEYESSHIRIKTRFTNAKKPKIAIVLDHPKGNEGYINEIYLGGKPLTEILKVDRLLAKAISKAESIYEFDYNPEFKGDLAVEYIDINGNTRTVSFEDPVQQAVRNLTLQLKSRSYYYAHLTATFEEAYLESSVASMFASSFVALRELQRPITASLEDLKAKKALASEENEMTEQQNFLKFLKVVSEYRELQALDTNALADIGAKLTAFQSACGSVFQ